MKIRIIALVSILLFPNFLYATTGPLGSLVDLANTLAGGVVTSLGYLMFTLAVVAFLFGMVQFIWNARSGDAGKGVENGKQFMLWGLIALFVMFSVWGIIKFTQGVFEIQGQTTITIPNIQLLGSTSVTPAGTGGDAANVPCALPNSIINSVCTPPSSSNPRFDACIAAGGGVSECRAQTTCVYSTACTTTNAVGATVGGFCDNTNNCVPTRSSGGSGVTTTCPNGPRSVCTAKDASGTTYSGICSSTGQCDPSNPVCSVTKGGVVYTGKYNTLVPPQCIIDGATNAAGAGATTGTKVCSLFLGGVTYSGEYNTATPPKCIPDLDISTGCVVSGGNYNPVDNSCSSLVP